MPFLLSVFTPIKLAAVTNLKGSRNHTTINAMERAGLTFRTISCDGVFDADQIQGPMKRGI